MHSFKDSKGGDWKIELTLGAVKRVKGEPGGIDLLQVQTREGEQPSLLARLAVDVELLCDVIYAICKPQADERSINPAVFAELLYGDVIAKAHAAFWEELKLFFSGLRQETTVEAINAMIVGQRRAQEKGAEFLRGIDASAVIDRSLGKTFTGLRESLELSQTDSPSTS